MLAANISSQITPTSSEAILAGVAEGSLRPVVGREMRLADALGLPIGASAKRSTR